MKLGSIRGKCWPEKEENQLMLPEAAQQELSLLGLSANSLCAVYIHVINF